MAKQSFTTGQILTAAQVLSLQQTAMLGGAASAKTASYTLVAADAGAAISMSNASATTITVNTALFAAGDTVQITNLGAGVCTITAGTATVNTSASLALAQYESGTLDFTSTSAAIFNKGAGAAATSGGMTSIATGSLSSNSTVISSITGGYVNLMLFVKDYYASAGDYLNIRFNGDTSTTHMWTTTNTRVTSAVNNAGASGFDSNDGAEGGTGSDSNNFLQMTIFDYTNTNTMKSGDWNWVYNSETGGIRCCSGGIAWKNATPAAITSITLRTAGATTWLGGTYELYGVK